jgi:hypothetical protein
MAQKIIGPELTKSLKRVLFLGLLSAYGMLLSFSWQGYGAISICFSTLFVLVTYRFTYLALRGQPLKARVNPIAARLLEASLAFLCLSSLGPFTLGPLAAMGLKQSSCYTDAIYWYLHFQMNGFMTLGALGLLATTLPGKGFRGIGWINIFVGSTIPLYCLFTLWGKPGITLGILAWIGTVSNLISWLMVGIRYRHYRCRFSFLEKTALIALTLKCIFQVLVCLPAVGSWTFSNRNLIIGYVHLLTLGIIMPLLVAQLLRNEFIERCKLVCAANYGFILLVIVYLCLLFLQPFLSLFAVVIPGYQLLLFLLCLSFLPIAVLLLWKAKRT